MNLRIKYSQDLQLFEDLPEKIKSRSEQRFLLLREFEDHFSATEKELLGSKFRLKASRKRFCIKKGVSLSSLMRWRKAEIDFGPFGLIPQYRVTSFSKSDIVFNPEDFTRKRKPRNNFITRIVRLDANSPLDSARILKDLIINGSCLSGEEKRKACIPLDFLLSYNRSHYFSPRRFKLSPKDVNPLRIYQKRTHRNHWSKATALLMASDGYSIFEISVAVGRSPQTLYRWFSLYRQKGLGFIETKMDPAGKKKMWEERAERVFEIIHSPPKTYNVNRTSWTYGRIRSVYKELYGEHIPQNALTRIIKESDYTWRHARQVLTSTDPDYVEKVAKVMSILHKTQPDEAFLFMDELGPYVVKKYGGKALSSKKMTRTIPSGQKGKGAVQAIGALEVFTNQLTWTFTDDKSAKSVLDLFEDLRAKYADKKRLIISWDAISTHHSSAIKAWIKHNNRAVKRGQLGPSFLLAPLPSKSQFLNVIESVFSGMKKAVIHNSDYASKEEMIEAIDRHFRERNVYFKKNPRRAGHKIWDKEAFDLDKLRGGLFRKM